MTTTKGNFNELALFCGAGGGLLASRLLGWRTVAACEINPYPRRVIHQRQNDGSLDQFPIWDDIKTLDAKPFRGVVDIVSGGFPCQDISAAGRGAGLSGSRSGLWFEYLRIVEEARPTFVFAENSPRLRTRGLGTIIAGLTKLGYGVRWCVLGAGHIGACHQRDRMWVLAYNSGKSHEQSVPPQSTTSDSACRPRVDNRKRRPINDWWVSEPKLGRVVHGVADRVDRITAIGNGQVPAVAASAWVALTSGLVLS